MQVLGLNFGLASGSRIPALQGPHQSSNRVRSQIPSLVHAMLQCHRASGQVIGREWVKERPGPGMLSNSKRITPSRFGRPPSYLTIERF